MKSTLNTFSIVSKNEVELMHTDIGYKEWNSTLLTFKTLFDYVCHYLMKIQFNITMKMLFQQYSVNITLTPLKWQTLKIVQNIIYLTSISLLVFPNWTCLLSMCKKQYVKVRWIFFGKQSHTKSIYGTFHFKNNGNRLIYLKLLR